MYHSTTVRYTLQGATGLQSFGEWQRPGSWSLEEKCRELENLTKAHGVCPSSQDTLQWVGQRLLQDIRRERPGRSCSSHAFPANRDHLGSTRVQQHDIMRMGTVYPTSLSALPLGGPGLQRHSRTHQTAPPSRICLVSTMLYTKLTEQPSASFSATCALGLQAAMGGFSRHSNTRHL